MIDFCQPAETHADGDRSMTPEDFSLHTVDIANTVEGMPVFVYRRLDEQTVIPAKIGDEFTDQVGQRWLATPTGWRPANSEP